MIDNLLVWYAEHVGSVLTGGVLVSLGLAVAGAVFAWRRWKRLDQRPRRWIAFSPSLLMFAAGGLGVVLCGTGLAVLGPGLVAHRAMIGQAAPAFVYVRLADGSPASLADHRGRVVLVNVWATWCPPCVHELPALDRLQRTYRHRGLVVAQVSDEDAATLSAFLAEHPTSTEHGRADSFPWPEAGRPTTFLIDREGIVRRVVMGSREFEYFERLVAPYL